MVNQQQKFNLSQRHIFVQSIQKENNVK